ncbi:CBS domain-containing protein [Nocardiopsis sp. CNT312]|uniref:CBS domain-containing protein n=1 Tax=Nocardiopsis sp. CNT312 TaxID=1137268 RepID=UPI00048DED72|nr:CBS domain-containing protein [Nocardiopsis sp. CNT312]
MNTVRDVMTTGVVTATGETGYREIVRLLVENRVSALPVVDDRNRVVGVVSEEDLLHKEEFTGEDEYGQPLRTRLRARLGAGGHAQDKAGARAASGLMTAPAVTVPPQETVAGAARLMEKHGIKRLPVVDGQGRLVGVVSRCDLLSVFLREDEDIAADAREEITDTLRAPRAREPAAIVEDGVVRLSGTVERRSDAQAVIRRVHDLEGVVAVDSDLAWRVDDVVPEHVRWRSGTP